MSLDGAVEDAQSDIGRDDFDHGDFGAGRFVADGIHHFGGLQCEEAGLVDFYAGLGNVGADGALIG